MQGRRSSTRPSAASRSPARHVGRALMPTTPLTPKTLLIGKRKTFRLSLDLAATAPDGGGWWSPGASHSAPGLAGTVGSRPKSRVFFWAWVNRDRIKQAAEGNTPSVIFRVATQEKNAPSGRKMARGYLHESRNLSLGFTQPWLRVVVQSKTYDQATKNIGEFTRVTYWMPP